MLYTYIAVGAARAKAEVGSTPCIDQGFSDLRSDVFPLHHVEVNDHGARNEADDEASDPASGRCLASSVDRPAKFWASSHRIIKTAAPASTTQALICADVMPPPSSCDDIQSCSDCVGAFTMWTLECGWCGDRCTSYASATQGSCMRIDTLTDDSDEWGKICGESGREAAARLKLLHSP